MNRDRLIIRISLLLSLFATCGIIGLAVYEKVLHPSQCSLSQCQPNYLGSTVVDAVVSLAILEFTAAGMFLFAGIRYIIATRRYSNSTLRTL